MGSRRTTSFIVTALAMAAMFAGGSAGAASAQYSICNGTVCKQVIDVVGFADPWGAGPLMYGGGPIQKYPKVYLVYLGWTSDPSGEQLYLEAFFNGVGGSSWANIDTQYDDSTRGNVTNPTGQLAGIWSDPTSVPATVTGGDI